MFNLTVQNNFLCISFFNFFDWTHTILKKKMVYIYMYMQGLIFGLCETKVDNKTTHLEVI